MLPNASIAKASVAPKLKFVAEITTGATNSKLNGFSMPPVNASIEVSSRISNARWAAASRSPST